MGEPTMKRSRVFSSSEVREIFVITLGILLAFGVDAWWTASREAAELDDHLAAVDAELAQNIEALQEIRREAESVAEATAALIRMAGPAVVAEHPDSIANLVGIMWFPIWASTSQGALETLRSSGLLAEVSDPELRQLLASWPARLQAVGATADMAARPLQQVISPLLHRYVSEVDLNRIGGFGARTDLRAQFREMARPSAFPSDYTGLLRDRQMESLLGQRAAISLIIADIAAGVQEEARHIRSLLGGA
jgi:hypothetical protein